jgi:hypothetical protein
MGMIKGSIRQNKAFTIFCSVSTIFMAAGLMWFLLDDPPLQIDYIKEDIVKKPNGSYQYIDFFNKADTDALKKANEKLGEGYKGKVSIQAFEQVWEEIADYRHAIDELDEFDYICDLPEGIEINMDVPFMRRTALREISKIYGKYFLVQLSQGKGEQAAEDLCRLHRVARKGMVGSTILINKMIFNSIVMETIDIAYITTLNQKWDENTLTLLKENFIPLGIKELSHRKPIITEYLMVRNTIQEQLIPSTFLNSTAINSEGIKEENNAFVPGSYFAYYFGFKPNKSLLEIKEYFELFLEDQNNFPVTTTKARDYFEEYCKQPPIRNMVGWILNTIAMPNFETYYKRMEESKIKSGLLALKIYKQLREPQEIIDFYTKAPYVYEEDEALGSLRHPGKDGKFGNHDDIILGAK